MKYKLIVDGKEYILSESERNSEMIRQVHSGSFPGLRIVDTIRGPIAVNLSEQVAFVVEGDEFRSESGKPRVVVMG